MKPRILVIGHGHPDLIAGGAERAAYSLFKTLKAAGEYEPVFVARATPPDLGHSGAFATFRGRPDEILWAPPVYDHFRVTSLGHDAFREHVSELAARFRPRIVHAHHYMFMGIEMFRHFREFAGSRNVLTLHEYKLICHNDGQMVKTQTLKPCYESSPAECHACFPHLASGKFFLRNQMAREYLAAVDAFVSTSHFCTDRHANWGIPREKITTMENIILADPPLADSAEAGRGARVRFGYFGQLNPYKGAHVLLDAVKLLSEEHQEKCEIVIFGANLEFQSEAFQADLRARMAESPIKVSFYGRYRNEDVARLMRDVDWMVIPSIWWENSPLVIQEARVAGTPILCSNIGGMAEKVEDGVTGAHFLVGSPAHLAEKIAAIVDGRIHVPRRPLDIGRQNADIAARHMALYRDLLAKEPAAASA